MQLCYIFAANLVGSRIVSLKTNKWTVKLTAGVTVSTEKLPNNLIL